VRDDARGEDGRSSPDDECGGRAAHPGPGKDRRRDENEADDADA
jgi:hypothetical protein